MTEEHAKFYTRIEVHSGPDRLGRYSHTRFWMTDYTPGHPDGEYKLREVGQVFFCELPPKDEILSALTGPQGTLELTPAEAGIHDPAPECEGEIAA